MAPSGVPTSQTSGDPRPDPSGGGLDALLIAAADRDGDTVGGQRLGRTEAEPGRGRGHGGPLAGQSEIHRGILSPVPGRPPRHRASAHADGIGLSRVSTHQRPSRTAQADGIGLSRVSTPGA